MNFTRGTVIWHCCLHIFVGAGGVGEVEEEVKKEKMVTATKKGAAVLDEHIPDHIKVAYHVLQVVREFIFGYFFYLYRTLDVCTLIVTMGH